jgi:multiple sugar transport system substrate-binding protein
MATGAPARRSSAPVHRLPRPDASGGGVLLHAVRPRVDRGPADGALFRSLSEPSASVTRWSRKTKKNIPDVEAQKVMPQSTRARRILVPALLAASLLAACSSSPAGTSSSTGGASSTDDPDAALVVWTDSTRQAGFEAYKKAHPDKKVTIVTYEPDSLLTKIQLFNRTGKGWPDVIFDPHPNDTAGLSSNLYKFAQPLDELVPKNVQDGFGTANDTCKFNGKLYCLKNDLAQTVLWYNKPLMAKFGYKVPTTWGEYKDLGLKLAKEHPGYVVGAAGFNNVYADLLWPSGCPISDVKDDATVHIDVKDPKCTRVADLVDSLVSAGSLSRLGPFDADFVKLGKEQKILLMPGASWYGDFLFKPENSYATPKGVIAAAPYPKWDGEDKAWSGAYGGGVYLVSSHSANKAGAVDIAQWMATSNDFQKTAPTYPAYGPAATAWSQRLAADDFYAENPFPALQQQAQLISPSFKFTRYPFENVVDATVAAKVRSGGKFADGLGDLQSQLTGLAQSTGYAVQ